MCLHRLSTGSCRWNTHCSGVCVSSLSVICLNADAVRVLPNVLVFSVSFDSLHHWCLTVCLLLCRRLIVRCWTCNTQESCHFCLALQLPCSSPLLKASAASLGHQSVSVCNPELGFLMKDQMFCRAGPLLAEKSSVIRPTGVHSFTPPPSGIWILKSGPSEQRLVKEKWRKSFLCRGGSALQSVMEMLRQRAVMFGRWSVTQRHFNILMHVHPSYLSISDEAGISAAIRTPLWEFPQQLEEGRKSWHRFGSACDCIHPQIFSSLTSKNETIKTKTGEDRNVCQLTTKNYKSLWVQPKQGLLLMHWLRPL